MNDVDLQMEALAEAVVFAHDSDTALPTPTSATTSLERTATLAAAALAGAPPAPDRLQRRLAAAGLAFCAERAQLRGPTPTAGPRVSWLPPFLLGLAAAAVLSFALLGNDKERDPSARRTEMLTADASSLTIPWQGGPSPLRGRVEGDVVWSQSRQEGYLRFRGLPPLDAEHRFQLWIVDGKRDGAPVDGGLFAIDEATGETVVPVKAALPIGAPKAFVVTVETRAGVVVSKQEHVVAIAGL